MDKTITAQIKDCIESTYNWSGKDYHNKIIVFPYGDIGIQLVSIMKNVYGLEPAYIIDNNICMYNSEIKKLSFLNEIETKEYIMILATTNRMLYSELKKLAGHVIDEERIIELEGIRCNISCCEPQFITQIGRHSYGSICYNHEFIESIGSFCSFAVGVDVVGNHEMKYLTTSPVIYAGQTYEDFTIDYKNYSHKPWYVEGVQPKPNVEKRKRIKIANDVWLGRNVLITNYSNIGNGVIAGAGAIITKDVPDYAVVCGVPARIIRYRYNDAQIKALNRIAWWDWTDDEIRERFDDFYIPIDDFIRKYG